MNIITTKFILSSLAFLCLAAVPYGAHSQTLALADPSLPPSSTKNHLLLSSPNSRDPFEGLLAGASLIEMKAMKVRPVSQTELSRMGCARSSSGWNRPGCQDAFNRARSLQSRPAIVAPAFSQDVQAFRMASVNPDDVTLGLPKRRAEPPVRAPVAASRPVLSQPGRGTAEARAEALAAVNAPVKREAAYDYRPPAVSPVAYGATFGLSGDAFVVGGALKLDGPPLSWGSLQLGTLAIAEGTFAPGATRGSLDTYGTVSVPLVEGLKAMLGAGPVFGGGKGGFGAGGGLLAGVSYELSPGWTALAYGKITSERYNNAWQNRSVIGLAAVWSLPQ